MNAKILVLLAIVNIARARDIVVGSNEGGRRIYDENKQANPAIWRQAENVTIAANVDEVISKILITDMRLEKDGDATIVEGGEGQRNVTIELKSPTVLRGYDFHIEIFAIPDESQKTTGHKVITEKPTIDTKTATIANLEGHQTSSTTQGPSTTDVNLRHNRDTEAKEKSEDKSIPPVLTSTIPSTEASKTPLANISPTTFIDRGMKNDEAEQKFPIVNRRFPQEPPFGHPQVRVYEVNEMPESTARGIPSENAYSKSHHEDNNMQVPLNMNKMYTHVNYRENNEYDFKHSPSQMANKDSPLIKSEDNKNHRQKRNVNKDNTSPAQINNQKAIAADKADTVKENPLPKQDEQPIQTIKLNSIGIDKHQDHLDGESKPISNQQGTHNGFHPRQLHRSFTNIPPVASSTTPSINGQRISSPLPIHIEPTQHAIKGDVDSKPNKQSEGITEINPKQSPVIADSVTTARTIVSEAIKENKRNTRDTAGVADKNDFLQPPTLHVPSSTILPISPKNTLPAVATTACKQNGTEVHLNNSSVQIDSIKAPHSNEDNDRNPRETNVKNDDKKINPLTDFKSNIDATKTKTESDHASNDTVAEADHNVESPVEPASKKTEVLLKDDIKKAHTENTEDKERLTRDTSSIDKEKLDVKTGPTLITNDAKTKSEMAHSNEENRKQLPTTNDKLNLNKDEKMQTPHSHALEERASEQKTKDVRDNKGDQSLKTPSGQINGKDSIKTNAGIPLTDIPLATDLKIDSEDKQTSIKELTKTEEKKP